MRKKLYSLALVLILLAAACLPVSAANGYGGYAVYRDGVTPGAPSLEWHAAIMQQPSADYTQPIIHHPGGSSYVKRDSWSNFIAGNNFKGIYRPNDKAKFLDRTDFVVDMARRLAAENIEYDWRQQIKYTTTDGYSVYPEDITHIRCDGVVEYCYEYYGLRICGGDDSWNITRAGNASKSAHGLLCTPRYQAGKMTLVSLSKPTGYK